MVAWESGELRIDGRKVQYYRAGAHGKPPVILLHGFTNSGLMWTPLARDLEAFAADETWPWDEHQSRTEQKFILPLDASLEISGRIDRLDRLPPWRPKQELVDGVAFRGERWRAGRFSC